MKQFITRRSFIKAAGAATALTAVSVGAPAAFAEETNCFFGDKADVTILYTNDVHTYIDNKSPKPTYAAIAALKKSIEDTGRDVLLVDAGDHIQGTAYGSMDDGATIIELMNEAGYDLATPGNHEFDYGMARAKAVLREADFPYVSCNWVDLRTGFNVLPSVKFFFVGGRKIAFVGVTTPETFTKSTPAYFMNDAQTKYIYDILGGEDGQKLYDAVQKAIDKAEFWGADTIIGLGHLGVDPSSSPWTSEEVIAHTHGFTAFIPWTFQPAHTRINVTAPLPAPAYLRLLAVSRLVLDNIPNIQSSWVTMGPEVAQLALFYGANDFGSLMIEENVVAAAGVSYHLTRHEIHKIIRAAGFTPVQRTMNYTPVDPQPED